MGTALVEADVIYHQGDPRSILQTYVDHDPHSNISAELLHQHSLIANLERLMLTTTGREFIQRLVSSDEQICRVLVARLCGDLHQPTCILRSALRILQQLASIRSAFIDSGFDDTESSYYGRAPMTWQDILTEDTAQLLTTLLTIRDAEHVEAAMTILGLLVQEQSSSGRALQLCIAHWNVLIEALPYSSFCCASVLRQDQTTLGMTFFQPPHNSTSYLVHLFQQQNDGSTTAIHAAWMLQGLSFREDAVVDYLCNDLPLMETVILAFQHAHAQDDRDLLIPLVQATGNLVTASNGKYVAMFLSQPIFVNTLSSLLQEAQVLDVIPLAGCLLIDCGLMQHPSTSVAAPALLPGLTQALLHVSYDWRSHAVEALATALEQPMENRPYVFDPYLLRDIVQETLWQPSTRVLVMESLASLIRMDNVSATVGSLAMLEMLFSFLPESRQVFASIQGVRRLDELCNHVFATEDRPYSKDDSFLVAQNRAAHLLDRYFDEEDDEDENDFNGDANLPLAPPTTLDGRQFVFGLESPDIPPQAIFSLTTPAAIPTAGQGRGRGRVMPAWMQTQQKGQPTE
jgi:hypothetical protein